MSALSSIKALVLGVCMLLPAMGLAQSSPIIGGTLYVAQPGPVSMSIQGLDAPSSFSWLIQMGWSTGPGAGDFATATQDILTTGHSGVLSGQGNTLSLTSDSMVSSSSLAAGTAVFLWNNASTCMGAACSSPESVRTGLPPAKEIFFGGFPLFATAAIQPGLDGTAQVGFPLSGASNPLADILDYPVRVLLSNVCVQAN